MTEETLVLEALIHRIETTRRTETVYPVEGVTEDFEPFDQLVIVALVEVGGVEYTQAVTVGVDAYPEVVDRVEALARERLAREVIEALR
jgi:hypothetical protein